MMLSWWPRRRRCQSYPRHAKQTAPRRCRTAKPAVEMLEDRTLLAMDFWAVDQDGNFSIPGNWTNGVPGPSDIAVVERSVPVTVTVNTNASVAGLEVAAPENVRVVGGGTLTVAGDITNNGTIELTPTKNYNVDLWFSGTVTLTGTGQMLLDPAVNGHYAVVALSYGFTVTNSYGATVTNAAGHTIRSLGPNYFGTAFAGVVVNEGVMEADGSGASLHMYPGEVINDGIMKATGGGTLELTGNDIYGNGFTLDNTNGQIVADGGRIYYDYSDTIVGGLLHLNGSTLTNGAISGSTLDLTGASTLEGNSTLSGVTIPAGSDVRFAAGASLTINGTLTNDGILDVQTGTVFLSGGTVENDGLGIVAVSPSATLAISGNLLGTTHNADQFAPRGTVLLNGSGTAAAPQRLEVMSQDLGNVAAGFQNDFAYGTLTLGNNTYVRLVDKAKNSTAGTGPEALYVNALSVPAGCTLDLNGLHVYTRIAQIAGTVIGGTVAQLAAGGPLTLNTAAAGVIQAPAAIDTWTFFGRANQTVSVVVNTGSQGSPAPLPPTLNYAEVQVLDPAGHLAATKTNTQAGADALLGMTLPTDGTYTVNVAAPASHPGSTGDYDITVWNAPITNYALNLDQTVHGQLATPYAVDHWSFAGGAGQQVQFNLLNASSSSVLFDLTGPGGYTAFSNATASSGLIDLPSTGTYTVTAHTVGQAATYAVSVNETSVTPLTLNTPYQGTLAGSGQAQLFTVTLSGTTAMGVLLSDPNRKDQNEVYVSRGTAPTRDSYQYRFSTLGAGQKVVLTGQAGTYDILLYSNLVTTPGSSYTLTVQGGPFVLAGLTPGQVGSDQPATLLATGVFPLEYQSATAYQIQFVAAGGTVYPTAPLYLAPTSLDAGQNVSGTTTMSARLPAGALPAGVYSVRVIDSLGDTQTLANALTVTAGGTGMLKTNIILPEAIGYHAPSTLYVQYSNVGTAPLTAPLLVFTATRGGQQGAFLALDPALAGIDHHQDTTPAGYSQTVQFLASGAVPGILQPGESVTVPVYYAGWRTSQWSLSNQVIFSVGELDAGNTQPIDWSSLKDGLRPGSINAAAWDAIFPILTVNLGSTWGQYLQTLDNDAVYIADLGEPTSDLSQLLSFEIEKANAAYTAQTLMSVTAASLPAPGLDLSFTQSFQQSISGRYTAGILGYGWTTNWDISATVMPNGDVAIKNDGISLYFSLQPNGTFTAQAGDQGTTLTASGGAYQLTEPDGTVYQFNATGTLTYVQDTHGNRITAGHNPQQPTQLVALTHSNGESLTLTYNPQGHLATLTDSNGQAESYGYDSTGQFLTSYTDVYGTTSYTYVAGQSAAQNNALAQIAYADNTHVYFGYDAQGRLTDQHRDGGEEDQTWTYLSPGGYTVTDANQNRTTVYFDRFGATAETIDPLGCITRSYFDSNLNLTKVIGPGGATYTYTHDATGNVTSQTDPLGLTTTFTHDAHNNLTSYTDAKGNTTSYAYNSKNDLLSITYANGTQQQYSYNPLGQATQYLNARGQAIGYTYTTQGLVKTETFTDGTSFSYTYSPQGNLTSATDAQGNATTFQYTDPNNSNLLTEVDYPDGTWLKFQYNVVGQRTQSKDQTGFTVNYTYDSLGRLSKLTDGSGNLIVAYTYDHAGNLIQKDMGNGTRTVYTYNADGAVLSITNYAPDHVTVNSFDAYIYDPLGNVQTDTNQDGQWVYTYDADTQLTHAVFTPNAADPHKMTAQDLQYVYDAAGNRQSETANSVTTTYVVNNVNQYTSSTTKGVVTSFQYDANGNLIAQSTGSSTTTYSFNVLNDLTAVSGPGVTASYGYDSLGTLVTQTVNGVTTNYQIDPAGLGNVVATSNASSAWTAHYTYGLGLVSQSGPAGTGYYDFDASANTLGITGSRGTYVNEYSFMPFGEITTISSAMANSFTFVGQLGVIQATNNLLYMRARFYTPATGQFLTIDSIGLTGGDTNLRRYVANAPIGHEDPSGNFELPPPPPPPGIYERVENAFKSLEEYLNGVTKSKSAAQTAEKLAQTATETQAGSGAAGAAGGEGATGAVEVAGGASVGLGVASGFALAAIPITAADDTLTGYAARHPKPPTVARPPKPPVPPGSAGATGATAGAFSQDPNSLVAPAGYGTQNYVAHTALLPYQIDFENDPTATAPAQRVDISDPLPANLDWSTFQLTAVGFGSTYLAIPAGLQHHDTTVNVTENGQAFEVVISLDLNPATGVFSASFQSIDPATNLPPASVLTGFLPPEDGSGRGMGFVSFTVRAEPQAATGTQIRNVADISFDFAPVIATDQKNDEDPSQGIDPNKQALVTIDAGAPTSHVNPLPHDSLPNFTVSWTGQDDPGGSGVGTYDIYVSDDGGAWQPWQRSTMQTSAVYAGQLGHSYAFYSVATDNVGNQEVKPAAIEAQTHTAVLQASLSEAAGVGTPSTVGMAKLLAKHYTDAHKNARPGIAVIGLSGIGTWQYASGGAWTNIGAVSDTNALLLPQTDALRFNPAGVSTGEADLLYVAWDGLLGTAGGHADVGRLGYGGGSPFSANAGMVAVNVTPVNHAPTWTAATVALYPELPGTANAAGESVQQALAAVFHDPEGDPVGIAITAQTGTASGTWQYFDSGTQTWTGFPAVSTRAALLLAGADVVRFLPKKTSFTGTVTLIVHAWDGTQGQAHNTFNLNGKNATGGTSAFSVAPLTATLAVQPNHAPFWAAAAVTLTAPGNPASYLVLPAQVTNPPGMTVASAFGSVFRDVDGNPAGIAITGVGNPANGTWQYASDGKSWTAFAASPALLLAGSDWLRFVPSAGFVGTATLTVHAWDGTQGTAGGTFDLSGKHATGGGTAFSTATLTASGLVNTVNVAPTWSGTTLRLPPVLPGSAPAGATVSSVFGSLFRDIDGDSAGIAVTGVTGNTASGSWEYSHAGGPWTVFGTPTLAAARLLAGSDLVRFLPKPTLTGTAALTALAWDGTHGTAGGTANLSGKNATGGTTAFSTTAVTLSVKPASRSPSWSGSGALLTPVPAGSANPPGDTVASVFGPYFQDAVPGASVGIGIVAVNAASGRWQYQLSGSTTWQSIPRITAGKALLLSANDRIRFVPARPTFLGTVTLSAVAWDGSVGQAGTLAKIAGTAFSSTKLTATCLVNTAPTLQP